MSKVVGRAIFIVWPVNNLGFIPKGSDLKKIPVNPLP
jgi:signal peptidase I